MLKCLSIPQEVKGMLKELNLIFCLATDILKKLHERNME